MIVRTLTALALFAAAIGTALHAQGVPAAPPQAQTPARDAFGPPALGTGIITGRVVTDDASARPIRRATVTLASGALGGPQATVTDDAGLFAFTQLAAGNYTLMASRPGYVNAYYGGKRPGIGPGIPVAVLEGQRLDQLQLRLLRGAAITGTLRSPSGVPIPGAPVQAIERGGDTADLLVNIDRSMAMTDDRGVYRIYGLRPADYMLMVRTQGAMLGPSQEIRQITSAEVAWGETSAARMAPGRTPPAAPEKGPTVAYAPTYFPGTADMTSAGSVKVGAGEERSGVDITIAVVATARVTGQLLGLDGQPVPRTPISVRSSGSSDLLTQVMLGTSTGTDRDGRFVLTNLAPGRYELIARTTPPRPGAPANAPAPASPQEAAMTVMAQMFGGGSGTLWAQQDVTVDGHDISDVALRLQPGMTVSGRIVFDGSSDAPAADPARTRIVLVNLPSSLANINVSSMMSSMAMASATADGSFQASGITPNQYRLQVLSPGMMLSPQLPQATSGWILKSAMLNGRDVADTPFDVKPGENVTGLVVTMTDRVTELSGKVVDGAGRPAAGFPIVVFSTDRGTWTFGSRRVQQARPSTDGRYRVAGLPAGEYYVCAVTELSAQQLYMPSYLEQLVPGAFKITIAEGEKKTQDLKLGGGQ